jgi:alpha-tubulin suppressor-like RCC1 family protein
MAKITANNIFLGAITSDKLDASVASDLAAADNANTVATIATSVAAAAFASANTNAAILANSASPLITTIQIADASYNVLDDTAANTTGGFVVITGSGFTSNSTVVFGTTAAPAVSFVSSTVLRAQTPALTAASYPVYVVNSNGGTAIRVNGLTTSSFPAWSTGASLSNQNSGTSFGVNLSASSDSNITYANTSALPAGTTLAANGFFSGTVSIGSQTTYTFDVKATDAENQDASRTFSLTITVLVPNLYTWGAGGGGALFLNNTITKSSPTQVASEANWNKISAGRVNIMATKTDGTLWVAGYATRGQLGTGTSTNDASSPVQVGSGTNWNKIFSGNQSSFAIKTDGTLWSWGFNTNGQLGLNDIINRSSPVQIGSGTDWSEISQGKNSSGFQCHAIKTNGTLWTWGRGNFGQLGIGDRVDRSSPVQVGTLTSWSKVCSAGQHTLATRTNGTLWTWGENASGQLGHDSLIYRSSPVQVGTDTTWLTPYGMYSSSAIKTDGTLWTWGYNANGCLGQNNRIYRSSPVQVGTDTTWSSISGGFSFIAKKSNGTIWALGSNNSGQLGLGDITYRSSPTQVGTNTNWNQVEISMEIAAATINQS